MKNLLVRLVGIGDVLKADGAADVGELFPALALGLLLHDLYESFEAADAVLELLHKADKRVDGADKEVDRDDEGGIVAKGYSAVVEEDDIAVAGSTDQSTVGIILKRISDVAIRISQRYGTATAVEMISCKGAARFFADQTATVHVLGYTVEVIISVTQLGRICKRQTKNPARFPPSPNPFQKIFHFTAVCL
jgi:hypothetical protein